MIVLDSSALLALLFCESGHEQVGSHLHSSCMSTVNLAEVLSRYRRLGKDAQGLLSLLGQSAIEFIPFSAAAAGDSACLLAAVQHLGLSLGDRVCLALARRRQLPVLTADRVWAQLDVGIEIRLIR
ncbi:type II toxin-antitoxin system VapC family toxin [bacterium]|nr:type II toxin-antitoxin system VapC family toxin [bacterium]